MDLVRRNAEQELREILTTARAAAVLGARQVGKSTLARLILESGLTGSYNTLDEDAFRSAALDDPDGVIRSLERPAVIDEIQRAPDLLLAIKSVLDESPDARGQFLITGSSNLLTNRQIADTLPGRVQYLDLWPFSQGEIAGVKESFVDQLLSGAVPKVRGAGIGRAAYSAPVIAGGYPEAQMLLTSRARDRFFSSYVEGVLSRDLLDLFDARTSTASFVRLLRLLSARTGGETNFSNLGGELELGHMAVKSHIGLLGQLYLTYELPAWSKNLGSRQVRSPKVYVSDSGMAAALAGIDESRFAAVDQSSISGALLETFVVMELVKQRGWAERRVDLYFYRDKQQREVDVVIEDSSGDVAAIEIKSAASPRDSDLRGLRFLRDKLGERFKVGVLLYAGAETLPFGEKIYAVPISGLWAGSGPTTA